MDTARIAELLQPFLRSSGRSEQGGGESAVLSAGQLQRISTYIDILLRWNARINLTAIRDPEEIVTRHFGESLFAARHLFPNSVGTAGASTAGASDQGRTTNDRLSVADVGSGAGFPGVPIKIWAPQVQLTLIESNHKKATFLREVTRAITLMDVNIQNARAETLLHGSFDVVTLRAVERFESILATAAALLKPGGCLALLIGARQVPAAQALLPQYAWDDLVAVPNAASRVLVLAEAPRFDQEEQP